MRERPITLLLLATAWGLFLSAMVWPAVALLVGSIGEGSPPTGGFSFSSRQLGLLWRSVWLSGIATLASVAVSLPGAYVVGKTGRLAQNSLIAVLLAVPLLCPPMVSAFGWERILPVKFDPYVRCIVVWALWAWPIPALLIGSGWSRVGRGAYEAALLVASPTNAFVRGVLPLLFRRIALSLLVLFVLFFGEYGVPHACGLLVYSTELLGWAASSRHLIDTAWPSILSVGVTGLALITMFRLWRFSPGPYETCSANAGHPRSSRNLIAVTACFLVISWLLPIAVLVVKLASVDVFLEAFRTYNRDLAWSLGVALLGGVVVMAMGLGIAALRGLRNAALAWAVVCGALPGALVGETLVAGYNNSLFVWVYDHWPIVMLSYVARFGWIGILTAIVVTEHSLSDLVAQAQVDGANRADIFRRIHIPLSWPTLSCCVAVVMALSVAEVAASSFVRVPSFSPISHILIEKFHRFEDGMLISLSIWLACLALPGLMLLGLSLRRWASIGMR